MFVFGSMMDEGAVAVKNKFLVLGVMFLWQLTFGLATC